MMAAGRDEYYGVVWACLFALLAVVVATWVSRRRRKMNLPPGPRRLPIIGNLHQLGGGSSKLPLHQRLRELAEEYGPVMRLQLGQLHNIVITSAEAAEQVMKTHDVVFASRPATLLFEILSYGSKDLAFSPYGDHWRKMRKLCVMELLTAKRVLSFRSHRMQEASNLVATVSRFAGEGVVVELKPILTTLVNAVVCRCAFGKSLKAGRQIVALLDHVMVTAGGFRLSDVFPRFKFLAVVSGYRSKLRAVHRVLDSFLDEIIDDHIAKRRRTSSTGDGATAAGGGDETTEDLVDILLNLQQIDDADPASRPLTMDAVKAVLQDMFFAGTDTATKTMEWAMAEMMKNPCAMRKAQVELRRIFRDDNNVVTEERLHELQYLDAVIKETLRLHPPGPFLIPRETREEVNLNGFDIPVKTQVLVNVWAIGRDPRYWDEPDKFIPERFINSTIDYKGAHFQFLPFGAGRRMCPGIQFGTAVIQLTLANLLFHFDWKLPNGMEPKDIDMTELFSDSALKRKEALRLIPVARASP